jgi:hypothetical protein
MQRINEPIIDVLHEPEAAVATLTPASLVRDRGRFAGYTKERRCVLLAQLEDAMRRGTSFWRAARQLGVGRGTLKRWLDQTQTSLPLTHLTTWPLHSRARPCGHGPRQTE